MYPPILNILFTPSSLGFELRTLKQYQVYFRCLDKAIVRLPKVRGSCESPCATFAPHSGEHHTAFIYHFTLQTFHELLEGAHNTKLSLRWSLKLRFSESSRHIPIRYTQHVSIADSFDARPIRFVGENSVSRFMLYVSTHKQRLMLLQHFSPSSDRATSPTCRLTI